MPVIGAAISLIGAVATGGGMAAIAGATIGTTMVAGAMVGAVVGGIVSAVKGENILKGALKGGLVGAAIGGALGGAAKLMVTSQAAGSAGATGAVEAGTGAVAQTTPTAVEVGTGAIEAGTGAIADIPTIEAGIYKIPGEAVATEVGKKTAEGGLLSKFGKMSTGAGLLGAAALQAVGAGFADTPKERDPRTTIPSGKIFSGRFDRQDKFDINSIMEKTPSTMLDTSQKWRIKGEQGLLASKVPKSTGTARTADAGKQQPARQQTV